jgi:transposase
MSEITTDDKNKLIAIFDGWEFVKGDPERTPTVDRLVQDGYRRYPNELQYHSDWSWLMPIWFKIQTIGADLGYSFKKFYERFHAGIDHQKIEMSHEAVFEFLQWYNQQKK